MARVKKTILIFEIDDQNWNLKFNGSIDFPPLRDKVACKHDERIMLALASDRRLFNFFYRLVAPVKRYYNRKDKKALTRAGKA